VSRFARLRYLRLRSADSWPLAQKHLCRDRFLVLRCFLAFVRYVTLHPVCVLIHHRNLTGRVRITAFIVSPWSDIASSYEVEGMFANGVAFFLFGWFSKLSALFACACVDRNRH